MALQGPIEGGRAVTAEYFGSAATGAALFRAADLITAGRQAYLCPPVSLGGTRDRAADPQRRPCGRLVAPG
jgi:hypothetical protein